MPEKWPDVLGYTVYAQTTPDKPRALTWFSAGNESRLVAYVENHVSMYCRVFDRWHMTGVYVVTVTFYADGTRRIEGVESVYPDDDSGAPFPLALDAFAALGVVDSDIWR